MATPINKKIDDLKNRTDSLENKTKDISTNIEEKNITPFSKVGGKKTNNLRICDITTGVDGHIIWNDSELKVPPYGLKPDLPTKGYNRHFHTRYAGGALDINSLEILEYDVDWATDDDISKHSQQFWNYEPKIKKQQNTNKENVEKIGTLALVFDADAQQWGASAFEIDVEMCYFVRKDDEGNIMLDEDGNEMKAPIFDEVEEDSCITWDKENQRWRFYAVYANTPTP